MTLSFSIIVPTLNRADMLLSALDSVRVQDWPDVEIIVVDGGSTDNTLDILGRTSGVRVLSGPDQGVYDALNKGIAVANGNIIGLLNSDDCYENGAFAAVARAFTDRPDVSAVCGTATLVENDRVIAIFDRDDDKTMATPRTIFIGSCIPNARFFRREALQLVGPFNLTYRYVSDRDFLARFSQANLQTAAVPEAVYRYRQHSGSMTFSQDAQRQLAIRSELLLLARNWRGKASSRFDEIVTALEGRCIGILALAFFRQGKLIDSLLQIFVGKGPRPVVPVYAMAFAVIDWLSQKIRTS